jgi:crotonobetainyl-CoA:carnitine CoA-transferase CaiB-like acyl-CoA transferase
MTTASDAPLDGVIILDATRLLPGAVLARLLLDLGARLIKIEDPAVGDPLRHAPPQVGGTSAAFAFFLRGAESICLDLRRPEGAASLRKLARHADVVNESFRPGTMERWGLGPERLRAVNPGLTTCSLSSFGRIGPWADRVGHDLNFVASSGLLTQVAGGESQPLQTQLADVSSAILAGTAIVAALLKRHRTGSGTVIDQPLSSGVVPLLAWPWADAAGGGGGLNEQILAGDCPCYRVYACGDGERLAGGNLEPKFWVGFVELLGLPHLAGAGLDLGEAGRAAIAEVEARLATASRAHWLELAETKGLPVSAVDDLEAARAPGGYLETAGLGELASLGEGQSLIPGPFIPSLITRPAGDAPKLGQHTKALMSEFGLE